MTNKKWTTLILMLVAVGLLLPACSGAATPTPTPTLTPSPLPPTPTPTATILPPAPVPTPTPTPMPPPGGATPTPQPPASPCAGLSGEIEVRVLVGPAAAVGLEPFAVGSIPFAVTTGEEPYLVQGGGAISYADVLVEEWGTYEVTLDLQTTINGECLAGASGEELRVTLDMAGQQMLEVQAEGFYGEYPWAGEVSLDLSFPLVDGATVEGEGWVFVLHPQTR